MKTKVKYLALIASAFFLGACSSSMQMSQSSNYQGDDLYFNPSENYSVSETTDNVSNKLNSSSSPNFAELEKKYTEILANDTTGKVDTTIYKSEDENPYERLFSDSYQESYERRLRGRANPYYGLGSWSYMYSDDYWYASSFRGDPYYNVIVMGSDVWVEPYYISSMFGWPYTGFGFYSYYWGRPWYMSPFYGGYYNWAYGNYYSIWHYNDYAYGYNSWDWNGIGSSMTNYHYGRRPETGTVNFGNRPISETASAVNFNERKRDLSDKQATFRNEKDGSKVYDSRGESRKEMQDPDKNSTRITKNDAIREPNRDQNLISRPSRESLNVNPTRVGTDDRKVSREHNPVYTRPNPGYSNEFNRSRNYPQTEPVRNRGGEKISTPIRSNSRGESRSYNPPPRISTPTNSIDRSRNSSGSSGISRPPASSRSGSSVSPSRSSSGSSRSSSGSSAGSSSRSSGSSSSSSSSSNSSSSSSRSR